MKKSYCSAPMTDCGSLTDIVQSIAYQEAALSHILNAEGEKIQKVLATTDDINKILKVNESVSNTIIDVTNLEIVLYSKLKEALKAQCNPCPVPPPAPILPVECKRVVVCGTVLDSYGCPISGAKVYIGGQCVCTDTNGEYSFPIISVHGYFNIFAIYNCRKSVTHTVCVRHSGIVKVNFRINTCS